MNFKIEKRIGVQATTDAIWALIGDLSTWSRWNPVETDVGGVIAFGGSVTLTERFEGLPERAVVGRIGDWQPYSQLVWTEKRGWQFNVIRYYEIQELDPGSCIVANGFIFSGLRGEGFHDKHKRVLRHACETIAENLKAASEAG